MTPRAWPSSCVSAPSACSFSWASSEHGPVERPRFHRAPHPVHPPWGVRIIHYYGLYSSRCKGRWQAWPDILRAAPRGWRHRPTPRSPPRCRTPPADQPGRIGRAPPRLESSALNLTTPQPPCHAHRYHSARSRERLRESHLPTRACLLHHGQRRFSRASACLRQLAGDAQCGPTTAPASALATSPDQRHRWSARRRSGPPSGRIRRGSPPVALPLADDLAPER